MALLPLFLGIIEGGARPVHALLASAWLAAFLFFNAVERWAKTPQNRRSRVLPAVGVWATVSLGLGVPLLVIEPVLFVWFPFFAPLVVVTFVEIFRRHERALLTRVATVLASSLMLPVAWSVSRSYSSGHTNAKPAEGPLCDVWLSLTGITAPVSTGWAHTWIIGAVLSAYFLGTIPFVRSLIRGRHDLRWVWASVLWYSLSGVALAFGVSSGELHWLLLPTWGALTLRALWMPVWQAHHRPIRPAVIGVTEIVWCFLVAVLLVAS